MYPTQLAIGIDQHDTRQPSPVTGHATLPTTPPERGDVPADRRRPEPLPQSDAADVQRSVERGIRIDQAFEGHSLFHQPLGLPRRTSADDDDVHPRIVELRGHLTQLRKEIETGDSAVVADRDHQQHPVEKLTQLGRLPGCPFDLHEGERIADLSHPPDSRGPSPLPDRDHATYAPTTPEAEEYVITRPRALTPTRRDFLGALAGGAAVLGLSACGSDTSSPGVPAAGRDFDTPRERRSRNGVLDVTLVAEGRTVRFGSGRRYAYTYNGTTPGPTARSCSRPRWSPVTAAVRGATRPGGTPRSSSPG